MVRALGLGSDLATKWAPMAITSSRGADEWTSGFDNLAHAWQSVAGLVALAPSGVQLAAKYFRGCGNATDAHGLRSTSVADSPVDLEVELHAEGKDLHKALEAELGSFLTAKLMK